jgi:hypothetical protein
MLMTTSKTIAIIGTGNVGAALGVRFAQTGHPVIFGTRRPAEVSELLAKAGPLAQAKVPADAAKEADVVFLAVPAAAVVEAARALGDLAGKVLVDCNNPLRWDQGPVWNPPAEGSLSAALAKACSGARIVKAFNTFGAERHADPEIAGGAVDVYMAGDDAGAKAIVGEIATSAGFLPVDAGPLRNAALLENMAMLWIHLATVGGQGRDIAFRLVRRGGG